MKKLLFILMLVISFLMSPFAIAEEPLGEFAAPGGVVWGQTKTELQAIGVYVRDCENLSSGHFSSCRAIELVKDISFANGYLLVFDNKSEQLVKLTILGKIITGDYYGTQGKEIYQKVNNAIAKKYPEHPPESFERGGKRVFDEPDEFYECIRYGIKCGSYITFFESHKEHGGTIIVQLRGMGAGKGYLSVGYESGLFQSLRDLYRKQDAEIDEDAL